VGDYGNRAMWSGLEFVTFSTFRDKGLARLVAAGYGRGGRVQRATIRVARERERFERCDTRTRHDHAPQKRLGRARGLLSHDIGVVRDAYAPIHEPIALSETQPHTKLLCEGFRALLCQPQTARHEVKVSAGVESKVAHDG
jgi:hypothetical protein